MIFLDNDTNSRQFWSFYFRCVCIWCMLRMCFSYCSTRNDWKPLEFNYVLKANKKRRSTLYENQILQVKLMFKIGRKQAPVKFLCSHDANNNWWYITIYFNNYIESRPPYTDMHMDQCLTSTAKLTASLSSSNALNIYVILQWIFFLGSPLPSGDLFVDNTSLTNDQSYIKWKTLVI